MQPAVSPVPSQRMEVYPHARRSRSSGPGRPVTSDPILCEQLRDRGIDPTWSATLPAPCLTSPESALGGPRATTRDPLERGRLLAVVPDVRQRRTVSVHARRFQKDDRRKGVLPGRYKVGGLVMLFPQRSLSRSGTTRSSSRGAQLPRARGAVPRPARHRHHRIERPRLPLHPLGARVTIWTDIDRIKTTAPALDRNTATSSSRHAAAAADPSRRCRSQGRAQSPRRQRRVQGTAALQRSPRCSTSLSRCSSTPGPCGGDLG